MTIDYSSVTFVISVRGVRRMIFFFPTPTQRQTCPVVMVTVASAARRIGFLFSPRIKEENATGDCGWEIGFRLLGTERTQTPNKNCADSVRTSTDDRKMADVFKHAVFKKHCAKG